MSKRILPPFDLVELEKLCAIYCTHEEIAAWFNVSPPTIHRRCADGRTKYEHGKERLTFKAIMERGYAKGRISLRRKQMQLAENGNATMLVWLGKMILGQHEVVEERISGPGGGPVQIEHARDILLGRINSAAARLGTDAPAERTDPRPN
jgi:hypothetical protein